MVFSVSCPDFGVDGLADPGFGQPGAFFLIVRVVSGFLRRGVGAVAAAGRHGSLDRLDHGLTGFIGGSRQQGGVAGVLGAGGPVRGRGGGFRAYVSGAFSYVELGAGQQGLQDDGEDAVRFVAGGLRVGHRFVIP